MALERLSEVEEPRDSRLSGQFYDDEKESPDTESLVSDKPPIHPIPAMQEAFEESIREASHEGDEPEDAATKQQTAEMRRQRLLDQDTFDDSWTTRWKQPRTARHHPLMKLMAQITFGMHLLHEEQAKSDTEVVQILQSHVDEIDTFLEKTTEDFELAIKDVEERIGFLRLPMTHLEVFDVMLDDKKFRTQLIDGNDKIEKIIERTAKAMNAALLDVQKGVNANKELATYLDNVQDDWPTNTEEQKAIYVAMRGNEEGWSKCLRDLQFMGNKLGVALVQLGTVIGEMSKLAAAASRRSRGHRESGASVDAAMQAPRSKFADGAGVNTPSTNRHNRKSSVDGSNKPLPKDPDSVGAAVKATIPKVRGVPLNVQEEHNKGRAYTAPAAALEVLPNGQRADSLANGHDTEDIRRASEPVKTRPVRPNRSVGSPFATATPPNEHDSAYASGCDPAQERSAAPQTSVPLRLAGVPEPITPPSPVSRRASNSSTFKKSSPPPRAHFAPDTDSHTSPKQSSSFSIRKMFNRKSKDQGTFIT